MNKMIKTAQLCAMALIGVAVLTTSCDKKDELMTVDKLTDLNFLLDLRSEGYIKGTCSGTGSDGSSYSGLTFDLTHYVDDPGTIITSKDADGVVTGYIVEFKRSSKYVKNDAGTPYNNTISLTLHFDADATITSVWATLDLNWYNGVEHKHIATNAPGEELASPDWSEALTLSEDKKGLSGTLTLEFKDGSGTDKYAKVEMDLSTSTLIPTTGIFVPTNPDSISLED